MGKSHDWAQYYTYIVECARKKGYTTASQLAHDAEVSESVLSKMKSGDSKAPSFDTIHSICEAAGASMDVMCGLKTDSSEEVADLRRELEEQKQINADLTHKNELLSVHVTDKDERLRALRISHKRALKWLSIVFTILVVFAVCFITLLIYDKMHPHLGWIKM